MRVFETLDSCYIFGNRWCQIWGNAFCIFMVYWPLFHLIKLKKIFLLCSTYSRFESTWPIMLIYRDGHIHMSLFHLFKNVVSIFVVFVVTHTSILISPPPPPTIRKVEPFAIWYTSFKLRLQQQLIYTDQNGKGTTSECVNLL